MSEETPAVTISDMLFKCWCRAIKISDDQIAMLMRESTTAVNEPAEAARSHGGVFFAIKRDNVRTRRR